VEGMAYLYNKFRVAATEVKRQVLKRKGEAVPELPNKVRAQCEPNLVAGMLRIEKKGEREVEGERER
jgi:hypothetical protein